MLRVLRGLECRVGVLGWSSWKMEHRPQLKMCLLREWGNFVLFLVSHTSRRQGNLTVEIKEFLYICQPVSDSPCCAIETKQTYYLLPITTLPVCDTQLCGVDSAMAGIEE